VNHAADNNPSSKALPAIVSTVSVDDDAVEGENVAVSPHGKLDLLVIREKRLARLGFHYPRISTDSKAVDDPITRLNHKNKTLHGPGVCQSSFPAHHCHFLVVSRGNIRPEVT